MRDPAPLSRPRALPCRAPQALRRAPPKQPPGPRSPPSSRFFRRTEAGRNTTILVFSELGRRVAENGSKPTDHGKGGVAFVLGHGVKGGMHGKHPSLDNLVGGELGFNVDFRSVYAGLCEDVLGCESESILGAKYEKLDFVG